MARITDQQIIELVGLTKVDPILQTAVVKYLTKNRPTLPYAKLIELAGHPCSEEQFEDINTQFKQTYFKIPDDSDGMTKQQYIDAMSPALGMLLAEGFKSVYSSNVVVDRKTGNFTIKEDADGNPDNRFLKCARAQNPPKPRVNPAGAPVESDPYKGSLQGLPGGGKRRTRKTKKRARKTKKKVRHLTRH
jgi:hypothetical protein